MARKSNWIDTAVAVLTDEGSAHLTIDRLSAELGLSKGSFYHHFKSYDAFKGEVLSRYEWESTTSLIAAAETDAEQDPIHKLRRLVELATEPGVQAGLQGAVRAWSMQDQAVRAVQDRIDQARLDYVSSLWREFGCSADEALTRAKTLYLLLVGGRQLAAYVTAEDLREICLRAIAADSREPSTEQGR
ncbi:TetR/AcrR family transcriptional regulator [Streptomyces sp. NPDC058611]|uniref:TetR/AcrR family transcriptional regulator n=1 Tax=unclassified Streptomyces TaxID=2593676 RepID=UPI003649F62D